MQASAQVVSTDKQARLFWLTPAQAAATAHEEGSNASPAYLVGMCLLLVCGSKKLDGLAECFKTGVGLKYDDYGNDLGCGVCRMLGVWTRHNLVSHIAKIPGAH